MKTELPSVAICINEVSLVVLSDFVRKYEQPRCAKNRAVYNVHWRSSASRLKNTDFVKLSTNLISRSAKRLTWNCSFVTHSTAS